jgi:nicotinamidase-related amidase
MAQHQRRIGTWNAAECALLFMDYQENVPGTIFEQDQRFIELNARVLAMHALVLDIPVVLSTVAVEMGINGPTIQSLQSVLPNVEPIDRTSRNAWEDTAFRSAVEATGRRRLVMCGISTSVCLTYPAVDALADGYDVTFVEDAVGDSTKELHDIAVLRLTHAGAVPNTTQAMMPSGTVIGDHQSRAGRRRSGFPTAKSGPSFYGLQRSMNQREPCNANLGPQEQTGGGLSAVSTDRRRRGSERRRRSADDPDHIHGAQVRSRSVRAQRIGIAEGHGGLNLNEAT